MFQYRATSEPASVFLYVMLIIVKLSQSDELEDDVKHALNASLRHEWMKINALKYLLAKAKVFFFSIL